MMNGESRKLVAATTTNTAQFAIVLRSMLGAPVMTASPRRPVCANGRETTDHPLPRSPPLGRSVHTGDRDGRGVTTPKIAPWNLVVTRRSHDAQSWRSWVTDAGITNAGSCSAGAAARIAARVSSAVTWSLVWVP